MQSVKDLEIKNAPSEIKFGFIEYGENIVILCLI